MIKAIQAFVGFLPFAFLHVSFDSINDIAGIGKISYG